MVWCRCALRCRTRARARGVLARHADALHRWLVAGHALNNHVDLLAQRTPWLRAGRVLGCRLVRFEINAIQMLIILLLVA